MNTVRRWNPLQEREELESQLATFFGLREVAGNGGKESLTVAQWSPLVDITETDHEYLIQLARTDREVILQTLDHVQAGFHRIDKLSLRHRRQLQLDVMSVHVCFSILFPSSNVTYLRDDFNRLTPGLDGRRRLNGRLP